MRIQSTNYQALIDAGIRSERVNIKSVRIEDWNGAAAIRISDELLESLAVELGDTIYIIEERADGVVRQILSKTPSFQIVLTTCVMNCCLNWTPLFWMFLPLRVQVPRSLHSPNLEQRVGWEFSSASHPSRVVQ